MSGQRVAVDADRGIFYQLGTSEFVYQRYDTIAAVYESQVVNLAEFKDIGSSLSGSVWIIKQDGVPVQISNRVSPERCDTATPCSDYRGY